MVQTVDAVYERGVLRPLQSLNLKDSEQVRVSICSSSDLPQDGLVDETILRYARTRVAGLARVPTADEVRQGLAGIEGTMADFIAEERGEF